MTSLVALLFFFSSSGLLVLGRNLQSSNGTSNDTNSSTANIEFIKLPPIYFAKLVIELKNIPDNLEYMKDWKISIVDSSLNEFEIPPNYYAQKIEKDKRISLTIFNNGNQDFNFNVSLKFSPSLTPAGSIYPPDIYTGNRALLGSNKVFATVLDQDSLKNYILPYNMASQNNIILINLASDDKNFPRRNFTKDPYDISYWDSEGTTVVSQTWLPFFSHCTSFGTYIQMLDVFEHDKRCILPNAEDTKIVNAIPTGGFFPKADECYIETKCTFEEDVTAKSTNQMWWTIDNKKIIYYLTSQGIDITDYVQYKNTSSSSYFQSLKDGGDDFLVPVYFQAINLKANSVPSKVRLQIRYNQVSDTEKIIVKANVYLEQFIEIVDPHPTYTLIIDFKAMDYLDLINAFQFEIPLYIFLFIIMGCIEIIGIIFFWLLNKMISRVDNPPILRIKQTFTIVFIPQLLGTLLGTLPFLLILILVYVLHNTEFFGTIYPKIDKEPIADADMTLIRRGRLGLMIFIVSLVILYNGACLIISLPSKEEEKLIVQTIKKKQIEQEMIDNSDEEEKENSKSSMLESSESGSSGSGSLSNEDSKSLSSNNSINDNIKKRKKKKHKGRSSADNLSNSSKESFQDLNDSLNKKKGGKNEDEKASSDEEDEEELEEKYHIRTILTHKRFHYITTCFFSGLLFLIFLELSYLESFSSNLSFFILGFIFTEALFSTVLQHVILKEILLLSPIIGAFELIQFVTVMASDTFQQFIISYLVRLSLLIGLRTYVDPILKNINYFVKILAKWASSKNKKLSRLLKNFTHDNIKTENIHNFIGTGDSKSVEFGEDSSLEPIITLLLSYTSKAHSTFLRPFIILVIRIFPLENRIPQLYGFKIKDLDYYLIFAFVLSIAQMVLDIFLLNSLELLHGFKLFNYFSYCKFRYKVRTVKWMPHNFKLDRSLNIQHRSIDNLYFSSQFYLINSIVIYGICMVSIGTSIMMRNKYLFVSDPVFFPMIMVLTGIIMLTKGVLSISLSYFFNIWSTEKKAEIVNLQSFDLYLNTNGLNIETMIEADLLRKHFVHFNKDWIIKNIKMLIKNEDFQDNDGYLLNLYRMLDTEEKNDQKEKKREEMLARKNKGKTIAPIKDQQKQLDFYNEHSNLMTDENLVKVKRSAMESLKKLLLMWMHHARESIYLKSLVQDIVAKKKERVCKRCGIDVELNVVENLPYLHLLKNFRVKLAGLPFNKVEWRKFYEKNQKFITLCIDCEMKNRLKMKQRLAHLNIKFHARKKDGKKDKVVEERDPLKLLMTKWLFTARASILHLNKHSKKIKKKA